MEQHELADIYKILPTGYLYNEINNRNILYIPADVCEKIPADQTGKSNRDRLTRGIFEQSFNGSYPSWSEKYDDGGLSIELPFNVTIDQINQFIENIKAAALK